MSKLLERCILVYDLLSKDAEDEIWSGQLTKVFEEHNDLGASVYGQVMNQLKKMDCVQQIQRGGGSAPSIWALLQEPTEDLYLSTKSRAYSGNSAKKPVDQKIADMGRKLLQLESDVIRIRTHLGLPNEQ